MKLKPVHALLALFIAAVLGIAVVTMVRKANAAARAAAHASARPSVAEFDLNDAERKNLIAQVEAGDAEAAYKLALYYNMLQLDYSQGEHWLTKAAALGHAGAKKWLDDIADRPGRHTP
jgi:uncharacterized protein HemX